MKGQENASGGRERDLEASINTESAILETVIILVSSEDSYNKDRGIAFRLMEVL